jgi:hypothetical protein
VLEAGCNVVASILVASVQLCLLCRAIQPLSQSVLRLQNNYPETLGKTVIINAPTGMALCRQNGCSQ